MYMDTDIGESLEDCARRKLGLNTMTLNYTTLRVNKKYKHK